MTERPHRPGLLRLQHLQPRAWQRAALDAGAPVVALLLVLADLATAWTLLILPAAVAAVIKSHDVVAGLLPRRTPGGCGHYEAVHHQVGHGVGT